MKKVFYIAASIMMTVGIPFAQDNSSGKTVSPPIHQNQIDQSKEDIFNDIMQTISPELKVKLDSTKHNFKYPGVQARVNISDSLLKSQRDFNDKKTMENIPKELKGRVEKTIKEIELKHQQRSIEFKEKLNQK